LFLPVCAIVSALNSIRLTTTLRILLVALLIRPPRFGNCAMAIRGLTSDEREYEAENWGRRFHAGLLEASFGCHTLTLFVDGIGDTVI